MLTVCTWLWGDKFSTRDVLKLFDGVGRNLSQEHQLLCITDRPDIEMDFIPSPLDYCPIPDPELTKIKGCYARLRMFDPGWQKAIGLHAGDRLVCIDLDTVITGPLDPLFDRPEPFVIMQGANASNPCPMNGALQLLQAGAHPEVWRDFNVEAAGKVPFHSFPDDQGWIWHKLPDAAGWSTGPEHGVYVYQKSGWPGGKANSELPDGARIVTFINKHPGDVGHLDWVKEHWR